MYGIGRHTIIFCKWRIEDLKNWFNKQKNNNQRTGKIKWQVSVNTTDKTIKVELAIGTRERGRECWATKLEKMEFARAKKAPNNVHVCCCCCRFCDLGRTAPTSHLAINYLLFFWNLYFFYIINLFFFYYFIFKIYLIYNCKCVFYKF